MGLRYHSSKMMLSRLCLHATVPEEYGSMLKDGKGELFYSFGMNERVRNSISGGPVRLRGGGKSTMGDEGASLSRSDNERSFRLAGAKRP